MTCAFFIFHAVTQQAINLFVGVIELFTFAQRCCRIQLANGTIDQRLAEGLKKARAVLGGQRLRPDVAERHRLPGRLKWSNLVLKRGTTDNNLFDWFKASSGEGFEANRARLERTTAALSMVNGMGEVVRTWVFYDAFPVKWSGPKFAATSSELATEELEVAHHGFRVDD